jgi:hypothetical protein
MALKKVVVTTPQAVELFVYEVSEDFDIHKLDSVHSLLCNGTPVNLDVEEFLNLVPKMDSHKLFIIDAESQKFKYYDFINNKFHS